MSKSTLVDHILLVLCSVSVPYYILFLITLHKFRKVRPFDSPFFRLSFSIGLVDILQLVNSYLVFRLPQWGYFTSFFMSMAHSWLPKFGTMITWFCGFSQTFGVFVLSFNRFTALVFPFQHKTLWSDRFLTTVIIGVQFLLPGVIVAPQLKTDFEYGLRNGSVLLVYTNTIWQKYYFLMALLAIFISSIGCLVFYTIMSIKLIMHSKPKSTVTPVGHQAQPTISSRDVKFAGCGLILFIILVLYGIFVAASAYMASSGDPYAYKVYVGLWYIASDALSWSNPYLLSCTSKVVREHLKIMAKFKRGTGVITASSGAPLVK